MDVHGEPEQRAAFADGAELPPMFRGHDLDVPYTAAQLEPTLRRLRVAVEMDLRSGSGTLQQRLAAAWTRIAELRLPRKAVPTAVLDEVERLVAVWDRFGSGGIARAAYALDDGQVGAEARRLEHMLALAEAAAVDPFPVPLVPSE